MSFMADKIKFSKIAFFQCYIQTIPKCITEVHDDEVRSRFAHAHMVSTGEGSILLHDRGVLGLYP